MRIYIYIYVITNVCLQYKAFEALLMRHGRRAQNDDVRRHMGRCIACVIRTYVDAYVHGRAHARALIKCESPLYMNGIAAHDVAYNYNVSI